MEAMMSSFNLFTPVTPPPESDAFPKPSIPRPVQNSLKRKASMQDPLSGPAGLNNGSSSSITPSPLPPTSQPHANPTSSPNLNSSAPSVDDSKAMPPPPPGLAGANLDPRYLAMVSRIAAYYQQRCQAVANYQQQRCQAWANLHRQRCQDMMQASMLVVAWYVRDRIQRRRRREKRKFKSGLRRRTGQSKITRTEVVRRWVKHIPEKPDSPNSPITVDLADPAEADFTMNREPQLDKDAKLFDMADNLIKSQYKKIDVPIMGVLNFDESDNDSESDFDEPDEFDEMDEDEDEAAEDDAYYDVEDEELYDDDDEYNDEIEFGRNTGSEVAHHGTKAGSGSRSNDNSESCEITS